ncbi:hypothetical protein LNP20_07520 [Klebsiella pneumoniae subsp. pneumoniae]|nr:hypothetical protein [Klebsiella pneumoniae subsp. pneumoniae]
MSPAAGEIVIFDRSWYNRAGVERVMGFLYAGGGAEVPRRRADGGARHGQNRALFCSSTGWRSLPQEQERRLRDRIDDGRKIWKLSPMDIKSF